MGTGTADRAFVYDVSGNLVSDGTYFYQYDGWNRLVQVNHLGTLEFDAEGVPCNGNAGGWLLHYTYDGLGRLIRRQVPWDESRQHVRVEWYYHDGVRRIHEVYEDPAGGESPKDIEGGPAPESPTLRTEREYLYTVVCRRRAGAPRGQECCPQALPRPTGCPHDVHI